jgi:hypothetical protein
MIDTESLNRMGIRNVGCQIAGGELPPPLRVFA